MILRFNQRHAICARTALASACALTMLAACATGRSTQDVGSADAQAALRLAASLQAAAQSDAAVLGTARDEMAALAHALTPPLATPDQAEAEPAYSPAATAQAVPPPDLEGLRSVFHGVHIASYRSRDLARAGWRLYRTDAALGDLQAVTAPVSLSESGDWFRLKAGPFDTRSAAQAVCADFEARGDWCQVTRFEGEPLVLTGREP